MPVDSKPAEQEHGHAAAQQGQDAGPKIELGRRYRFAASHRLYTPQLSDADNFRLYGKCANPYGHGHNYVLEISVSGKVDSATGMIANLADLDGFVQREILETFDHRSLNEDVPAFQKQVPTTENLCMEIFRRLKLFSKAKIERVRVEETSNNSFEYAGDPAEGNRP